MRTMLRVGAVALLVSGVTTARAQPPEGLQTRAVPDPAGLMRAIASQPFRYGGDVEGGLLGLPEVGMRPVHLAIGLGAPSADGSIRGEAMLFDGERRLLAEGPVDGVVRPAAGPSDGLSPCALRLRLDGVALRNGAPAATVLPAGSVLLAGSCSASTLAGELRADPPKPALLGRLIAWWGDRDTGGRYWLNAASFDPPPAAVPTF